MQAMTLTEIMTEPCDKMGPLILAERLFVWGGHLKPPSTFEPYLCLFIILYVSTIEDAFLSLIPTKKYFDGTVV